MLKMEKMDSSVRMLRQKMNVIKIVIDTSMTLLCNYFEINIPYKLKDDPFLFVFMQLNQFFCLRSRPKQCRSLLSRFKPFASNERKKES